MRRTQIQLDEQTYQAVRREAFQRGCSISAIVREALARSAALREASREGGKVRRFRFIGAGRSRQGDLAPVSERHDEALADARVGRRRR